MSLILVVALRLNHLDQDLRHLQGKAVLLDLWLLALLDDQCSDSQEVRLF